MNGEMGVPSTIGGRHLAISNYRRRWISSIRRRTIHKNRWISSSIEVPPFRRSIDMRVGHPHSYKGFSSIKAHREKREMMGENDGNEKKGGPPLSGRFCVSMSLLIYVFQSFCCGCKLKFEELSTKISTFRCPSLYLLFSKLFIWGGYSPL